MFVGYELKVSKLLMDDNWHLQYSGYWIVFLKCVLLWMMLYTFF